MAKRCYVYIMANQWSHVLYTGVTGNLIVRVRQHRDRSRAGFTQKYNVTSLVYFQEHGGPKAPIEREKEIKSWNRSKKLALIESVTPDFADLSDGWYSGSTPGGETAGFLQNAVKDAECRTERR